MWKEIKPLFQEKFATRKAPIIAKAGGGVKLFVRLMDLLFLV